MPKELLVKVCGMREQQNILQLLELPIQYIGHIFYEKSPRFAADIPNLPIISSIKKNRRICKFRSSIYSIQGEGPFS
ncbi:hypothetical protein [Sphingobacterium daejeonense]|uniref:hypothetical protein n=1 Tax=Sphingobacterium daejeonense TaxID=371142 RepID=UPI0010C2E9B8|nr:hypothetical protein [Sphingobacterium daejeonense]VTP90039.1 Phosphoribosylanthranilate isomerase [Sphingobacterium daejeonense]